MPLLSKTMGADSSAMMGCEASYDLKIKFQNSSAIEDIWIKVSRHKQKIVILSSSANQNQHVHGSLEKFLEVAQISSLYQYPHELQMVGDNSKISITFMHHLSCLSVDKDYNNENIYFYMAKSGENMTKFYHVSFIILWFHYETNPICLLASQMAEFSHFYELCGCKDLGEV